GNASAITTPVVKSQLTHTRATMLKTAIVRAALLRKGVSAQSRERKVILVSIFFLASSGAEPLRTILSDQMEVPTAPRSAIQKGIHPNTPTCASDKPDFSCK